jgi:mono/diheme cytochrome c family protein
LASVGCFPEPQAYNENLLAKFRVESEVDSKFDSARAFVTSTLERTFGKIDTPNLPEILFSDNRYINLLDMDAVKRSAGPVGRDAQRVEFGLYRKHCAACHGVTGDGYGPAAMTLSPYARDFRRGTFKFGTAGQNRAASHQDLVRIIADGIPGTAMPSMANLQNDKFFKDDVEALAYYVQFLSMRGEVERKLWLNIVADNHDLDFSGPIPQQVQDDIDQAIRDVADRWLDSASTPELPLATHPLAFHWPEDLQKSSEQMAASAKRGRELFVSEITACAQCHGDSGDGNGRLKDFDEWTKDWTIRAGIDPRKKEEWAPQKKLGLLKPVVDAPRNLAFGVFRGGSEPAMIFHRITHGIDGTPMPAAPRAAANPLGLTDDQIWDLVNYCQSLAYADETGALP